MEAPMQQYQGAGFSKEASRLTAAPRRPLTNRMYNDRLHRFAHWEAGQGFDLLDPTAAEISALTISLILTVCLLNLSKATIPT